MKLVATFDMEKVRKALFLHYTDSELEGMDEAQMLNAFLDRCFASVRGVFSDIKVTDDAIPKRALKIK